MVNRVQYTQLLVGPISHIITARDSFLRATGDVKKLETLGLGSRFFFFLLPWSYSIV